MTDPRIGQYFAEDGCASGPICDDSDDACTEFSEQEGSCPERVLRILAVQGTGFDTEVVWEAWGEGGEEIWPDDDDEVF